MSGPAAGDRLDRRTLLLGAAASAALHSWMARQAMARAQGVPEAKAGNAPSPQDDANGWRQVLAEITRDAKPIDRKLTFDVPEIAENGNIVPFTAAVESPMTEADHVRAIHLIATVNPLPLVASFKFTLASGKAMVTGRMRLSGTQDMLMVAELGNGAFAVTRQTIKVTVGGCGGG